MRFVTITFFAFALSLVAPTAPASANTCNDFCFGEEAAGSGGSARSSGSAAISVARRYMGTNPTGQSRRWCAHFMNMVERKVGRSGTGSGIARSYAGYGRRVSSPRAGDIAVLARKGGGHVGYVLSVDGNKVKLLSGNHGGKVGVGSYSRSRVVAFVRP